MQTITMGFERFDCYRVAMQFKAMVREMKLRGSLRDQMERASDSIVLNVAEGYGRRFFAEKARFYEFALGSACECAAVVELVKQGGRAPAALCDDARELLNRLYLMLRSLVQRFSS